MRNTQKEGKKSQIFRDGISLLGREGSFDLQGTTPQVYRDDMSLFEEKNNESVRSKALGLRLQ